MFSFHKPRVYRSVSGCCICRAKSSSSRFTDSKRYEEVFYDCFKLREDRSGEICNACVLLVKRWKKLPQGSQRHWHHVVDARAGHGSKPISKINKVKKTKVKPAKAKQLKATMLKAVENENDFQQVAEKMKKKLYNIPEINRKRTSSPSAFSDDVHFAVDCLSSESGSCNSSLEASPVPSPVNFDDEDCMKTSRVLSGRRDVKSKSSRRRAKSLLPQKNRASMSSFLDLTFWKREKTCCGIIFKGPFGEVLLDRRFLNPCYCRSNPSSTAPSPQFETAPKTSGLGCFSLGGNYEDEDDEVEDEDEVNSNVSIEAFRVLPGNPVNENTACIGGLHVGNYALKID